MLDGSMDQVRPPNASQSAAAELVTLQPTVHLMTRRMQSCELGSSSVTRKHADRCASQRDAQRLLAVHVEERMQTHIFTNQTPPSLICKRATSSEHNPFGMHKDFPRGRHGARACSAS